MCVTGIDSRARIPFDCIVRKLTVGWTEFDSYLFTFLIAILISFSCFASFAVQKLSDKPGSNQEGGI